MIVAFQPTFLDAMQRLGKTEQRRTTQMLSEFQDRFHTAGYHFEPIREALDPRVHSVRVSQGYRAIALKSPEDDAVLFVWVDQHDSAYRWARNKRFDIDATRGMIQMWQVTERQPESSAADASEMIGSKLLDQYTDEQLMSLGVSPGLLLSLREIQDSDEIETLGINLTWQVLTALQYLASGEPFDVVQDFMREMEADLAAESTAAQAVATDDSLSPLAQALLHPQSSAQVHVITSDSELSDMLEQPMERWRIFLHPSQKVLVEANYKGAVRVLGGAGTGKTVVAMHRARHLLRHVLGPADRVVFTTFTVNLADRIRETMATLCTDEEISRLDVISIDRLAKRVLEQLGEPLEIIYDSNRLESVWIEALQATRQPINLLTTVRQEYARVIQPNGVMTWDEYIETPRTGRSVRLSRMQRQQVWEVIESFRGRMRDRHWVESIDLFAWAKELLETHSGLAMYRAAIVDEGQDLHAEAYRFLRALVPANRNDLFIVGDAHQRIYSRAVVLGRCGISIRGQRSKRLRINYRTTEQIRRRAMQVLQGLRFDDLDGDIDAGTDISLMTGMAPDRIHVQGLEQEQGEVLRRIANLLSEGYHLSEIAVLARTNSIARSYLDLLNENGLPAVFLKSDSTGDEEGVHCGTMHLSKGLEFRAVFLVSVNEGIMPPVSRESTANTPEEVADMDREERSLLYVACTRARERLFVLSSGREPSPYWTIQ